MDDKEFTDIISLISKVTGIIPRESHKSGIKNFVYVAVKNNIVVEYKKIVFNFVNENDFTDETFEKYFFKSDGLFIN